MSKKNHNQPDLASFEGNVFEALIGFQTKVMAVLRNSSLNDDQLKLVTDRIKSLSSDVTAGMERTKDFDVANRLDAVYDEVKRLVEELEGGGHKG
jgi:hypothetical protein